MNIRRYIFPTSPNNNSDMEQKEFTLSVGEQTLTATFTDITDQANGSVIVRMEDTVVLATAVMSEHAQGGMDWFPLSVEYEEKFYAAGRILGSRFQRREGKPSDEAVLTGRIVDRTIRPLFDHTMRNSVQVVISVLSIGNIDPDVVAVNAASLALATSNIPWAGPVAAVRVGKNKDDDAWQINPTYENRSADAYAVDILACGRGGAINMIEIESQEIPENVLTAGLESSVAHLDAIQKWQEEIVGEIGREKWEYVQPEVPQTIVELYEADIKPHLDTAVFSGPGKKGIKTLENTFNDLIAEKELDEHRSVARQLFHDEIDELLHTEALERDRRPDGRKMNEVRSIGAQAGGIAPRVHGTGLFYRGGTHIFSALTLGGPGDSQIVEGMEESGTRRYMHHYNFPPFSVGETGRVGGFNRRAIGHGALAEKALLPVLPSTAEFPYTIRIVSEVLASNGSSSMGSACGSTLALMDAGVPIKRPVAGIAMGLIMDQDGNHKVLTDIQGPEDEHGDMDFKVAGTREGVTAVQMDVKVDGIPVSILAEAFMGARDARLHILDVMEKEIAAPRSEMSPHAPRIGVVHINPEKIGMVIGSGGKTINEIKDATGTEIDIEEDGTVFVTGTHSEAQVDAAINRIASMTKEWESGERAEGTVTRLMDFGAFVEIAPGTEGLVHVSELAPFHVTKVSDIVAEGETVPVVVKEVDDRGRINLSIKRVDPDFAKKKGVQPPQASK